MSMNDLTGWRRVSCEEREALVSRNGTRYEGLGVASSLTDTDGRFGELLIFTEWYDRATEASVLRDYRYPSRPSVDDPYPADAKPCEHYVPAGFRR